MTKGIIIFSASVVVSEVFGVSVVVMRERELKVGWGWGGRVCLKGGLDGVLKGGLGGFLKGELSEILIYQAVGEQVKNALLLAATRRQKHHTPWCYKFV